MLIRKKIMDSSEYVLRPLHVLKVISREEILSWLLPTKLAKVLTIYQ